MKVALVHDWLVGMRGGESVLEAIAELFPKADLFTLLYVPGKISPTLTTLKRHTSWLQKVPQAERRYRHFLPLMPQLIEKFDLSGFDLILSSSHCVAKGVRKPESSVHVSYVHAPMRYMWNRHEDYFGPERASIPVRFVAQSVRRYLQNWDRSVSGPDRIDMLIANSRFIASQIREIYGREAKVIYPFPNHSRFQSPRQPGKNYLMVGAFAPNKRVDLAIQTFNQLKQPLLIVGSGQEESKLKKIAGPTIDFLGALKDSTIEDILSKCRAFVFPGVEDFGIAPLEAMSAGVPVIAYAEGGALETVTEKTGVFFYAQTVESLAEAVLKVERGEVKFESRACRARAAEFSKDRFQQEYVAAIREAWVSSGKPAEALDEQLKRRWK